MRPQSRAWFHHLAQTQGGYFYPWNQVLEAPGGEELFGALLEPLLTPQTRVLKAGCAEGKDADRFGPRAASWTGYDFVPEFVELDRRNIPAAEIPSSLPNKKSPQRGLFYKAGFRSS
ncbi:MAG: hypothetical protein SFU83_18015 [Meiothermus sp.]|nr:hypothetical protein [Meiothermus sp.]